jgi:two-component system cell cycle sensor histidine kinase/response regulator CckA
VKVAFLPGLAMSTDSPGVPSDRNSPSDTQWRVLVEYSSDVMTILQPDGRIVYESPSIEPVLGYPPDELIGARAFDFVHPEDLTLVTGTFADVLRRGGAPRTVAYRFRHKDGSWRWVESIGRCTPSGVCVINTRDVTERVWTEQEARRSDKYRRAIESSMLGGVFAVDLSDRITYVNPAFCALVGRDEADLLGSVPPLPCWPAKREDGSSPESAGGGIATRGIETTCTRPDGMTRHVVVLPTKLRSAAGDITGCLACVYDITERKHLEERLRQTQKMEAVGRLAGGIAHDFNNLLTAILGYCELALDDTGEQEGLRSNLLEVHRAAMSAAGLTRQLLAFGRRQVLQLADVDVNSVVQSTARMLQRLIGEHVSLIVSVARESCVVRADAAQLEQVLINLAVNGRDAMPGGGRLAIGTSRVSVLPGERPDGLTGQFVRLSIEDTGCGMTPDVLAHVFEPFFTTKPRGEGTGLGLATVYGTVQQLSGQIDVDTAPGVGTTFQILLPLAESQRAREAEPVPPVTERGCETVLLVEDADGIRALAARVLRARGYRVLEAANGEEALAAVRGENGTIDLLLTDMIMPRMGGAELAAAMRRERPGLPCVFMSGYPGEHTLNTLHGPEEFLQKPFTTSSLVERVRLVLDQRG